MIAVVDDDVCFAEETQELLYESGFQSVIVVTHPHESSLALLEHMQLLVLDLDIGGTSGLSVLQTLDRRGFRPAVLIVSGSGRAALETAWAAASDGGFRVLGALQKPVSPTEFIAVVRSIDLPNPVQPATAPFFQAQDQAASVGRHPKERPSSGDLSSRPQGGALQPPILTR